MRAAGTSARCEAPHKALIKGGGWHKAEVTPVCRKASHEALRVLGVSPAGC